MTRRSTTATVAAAVLSGAVLVLGMPGSAAAVDKPFWLKNEASGQCLEVVGATTVQMHGCDSTRPTQAWGQHLIEHDGTQLINASTGACLLIMGNPLDLEKGDPVGVGPCAGSRTGETANQYWYRAAAPEVTVHVWQVYSRKGIDLHATTEGAVDVDRWNDSTEMPQYEWTEAPIVPTDVPDCGIVACPPSS